MSHMNIEEGDLGEAIRVWRDLVEPTEAQLDNDLTRALSFVKAKFNQERAAYAKIGCIAYNKAPFP